MTAAIRVRRALRSDEPTLAALAQRLAEFELPAWRTGEEIADADGRAMIDSVHADDPESEVFIAERGGDVAGCLHVLAEMDFFGQRHAHISVLATTAVMEGSGVGRALLAHAEEWARRHGLKLLTLNVFAGNARARRVYEKAGFVPEILKYAKPL